MISWTVYLAAPLLAIGVLLAVVPGLLALVKLTTLGQIKIAMVIGIACILAAAAITFIPMIAFA